MRRRVDPGVDAEVLAKAAHSVARRIGLQERMRRIGEGDERPVPAWPELLPDDVDGPTLYRRAVEYADACGWPADVFDALFRSARANFARWERERG